MSDMVPEVNRIIGNLLAVERSIDLPQMGSLRVERMAAVRRKNQITPAYNIVTFTSQQIGRSLLKAIAEQAQCAPEQAQEIYDRWLEHVRSGNTVTIEGVGILRYKSFELDAALDAVLNPHGHKVLILKRVHHFSWVLSLGIAAIVFALSMGTWAWMESGTLPDFSSIFGRMDSEQTLVVQQPTASLPAVAVVAVDSLRVAALQDSLTKVAEPAVTRPAPVSPVGAVAMIAGRSYVVLGVFSTEANALSAIESAAKQGITTGGVYLYGAKYMASVFESDDAAACSQFIGEDNDRFSDLWIYKAK